MSYRKTERGALMVEMALVAPLLFFLALTLWDVGNLLYIHSQLRSVARELVRVAAGTPGLEFGTTKLTYLIPPTPPIPDTGLRCTPNYGDYACTSVGCAAKPTSRKLVCLGYSFVRLSLLGTTSNPGRLQNFMDLPFFEVSLLNNPSSAAIPGFDAAYPPDSVTAIVLARYKGFLFNSVYGFTNDRIAVSAVGPYL